MDVDTSPLKRCSSAPVIPNATPRNSSGANNISNNSTTNNATGASARSSLNEETTNPSPLGSGSLSNDTPPAPNIFSRTRRYSSGSFSPLATGISNSNSSSGLTATPSPATSASTGPRLTPRVSQLRKEECADISNTREVSHERGLHNQLQISQSWEDLTIVTENWSCRDDLGTNSLLNCSSPSPTSSRHHQLAQQPPSYGSLRYPFGMSPSPTRKTFATRRSMSPNHVRPSQLCPVKRKFDMDDSCGGGSPPPHKKMFLDVVARGTSPIHSLPMCASPDSGTYEGRTTPKLFISKLCSSNSLSSFSSASASPTSQLEGMNETGSAATGSGSSDKGGQSTNSAGLGMDTAAETKDDKGEELADHPMLDVSKGEEDSNCDKAKSVVAADGVDLKEAKAGAVLSTDPEVDDGIGDEEVVLVEKRPVDGAEVAQEAEAVAVI